MRSKIVYLPLDLPLFFEKHPKLEKGYILLSEKMIILESKNKTYKMKYKQIKNIRLLKHNKIATYIQLSNGKRMLNFFVPRLILFEKVVIVNYFKTKRLYKSLKEKTNQ